MTNPKIENKKTSIIQNVFMFSSARMVSMVITLISLPVFTRLLTPSDYGIVAIYSSYLAILSPIVALGFQMSTGAASLEFKDTLGSYVRTVAQLSMIPAILFCILIIVFSTNIEKYLDIDVYFYIIMSINAFVASVVNLYISQHQFGGKTIVSFFIIAGQSFVAFAASYILISMQVFEQPAENRIFGLLMFDVIFVSIYLIFSRVDWDNFKRHVTFAAPFTVPFVISGISYTINANIDRIMVGKYLGPTEAGIYTVGVTIGFILFGVMNSIKQGINRSIYEAMGKNNTILFKEYNLLYVILASLTLSILGLVLKFFSQELLPLEYHGALPLIPIFLISSYLLAMNQIEIEPLLFKKKTKFAMIVVVIGALINTYTNYVYISSYGIWAASGSTVLSLIVMRGIYVAEALKCHKFILSAAAQILIVSMVLYTLSVSFLLPTIATKSQIVLFEITIILILFVKMIQLSGDMKK